MSITNTKIQHAKTSLYRHSNPLNFDTHNALTTPSFSINSARFISSLTLLSIAVSFHTHAAIPNDSPSIDLATNELVKEQQQVWQDQIQQQRIETLRQSQPVDAEDTSSSPQQTNITELDEPDTHPANTSCLSVQSIALGELPYLDESVQTKLRTQTQQLSQSVVEAQATQGAVAQSGCISVTKASELVRQITEAYLEEGYFKITIFPETVDSNQLSQGTISSNSAIIGSLNPSMEEGKTSVWHIQVASIESIDNQTELPSERLFGNIVGKPANIAWLDQAVANGEKLIDGRLLLDIYPVGDDVRIKVSKQGDIDRVSGDIEWRYDPDDTYGHNQIKLHTSLRNVLGQADLTSLSLQKSLTDKYSYDDNNQRRSVSLYSIIPNGRWQWSALIAADDNKLTTPLPNSVLVQEGDSWQTSLRGDFTAKRDQDSITTLYGQVAHQDVSSEILGSQLDNQSPTLSSARLGASYTKLFNNRSASQPNKVTSGAWVVDVSAEKAFSNHDNPATATGLSDDYWRWLLSGYLTHQHSIIKEGRNEGYWQMTHELQGQYSDDNLFGITRQSLGSTYSGVRGIDNAYNAASSGVTLRNTLSYEPQQSSWINIGASANNQLIRWSPYVGLDYGVLKYSDNSIANVANDDTNDAASATLGLNLTGYDVQGAHLERRWLMSTGLSRARIDYADQSKNETLNTEYFASFKLYF